MNPYLYPTPRTDRKLADCRPCVHASDACALTVHRWQAPATCGELFQGAIDGRDFMVNCPIDLFATAEATVAPMAPLGGIALKDARRFGKVAATLRQLESRIPEFRSSATAGIALRVDSPIPRGKGMASSTADASAALAAVLSCAGIVLDEEAAARLLTAVEPSDCTHFTGIARLDFLQGELLERFPSPTNLKVLVVDCGGEVETVEFDRTRARGVYAQHGDRQRDGLSTLARGLTEGCNSCIGEAATASAELSQFILPKKGFRELRALSAEWGLVGINCAHSGTVLGLLFEDAPGHEEQLRDRMDREFGDDLDVLGAFRIIGGGNRAI